MTNFTYRKQTTVQGTLIEETGTHYIIETNEDTFSWEKELTTIQEIKKEFKTKAEIVLEIQRLVAEKNIQKSYYQRYFGASKTVTQMINGTDKAALLNLLKRIW